MAGNLKRRVERLEETRLDTSSPVVVHIHTGVPRADDDSGIVRLMVPSTTAHRGKDLR
jgi:hypothetical protein